MGFLDFTSRRRSTRASRPSITRGRRARFEPLEQRRLLSVSTIEELMASDDPNAIREMLTDEWSDQTIADAVEKSRAEREAAGDPHPGLSRPDPPTSIWDAIRQAGRDRMTEFEDNPLDPRFKGWIAPESPAVQEGALADPVPPTPDSGGGASEQPESGEEWLFESIRIGVWTEQMITDLPGWVDSQQWPEWMMGSTRVTELLHMRLWSDPRGGYRTMLNVGGVFAGVTHEDALADLEQLDFVDFAKLKSQSPFRYGPDLQESIDAITMDGSDQPAFLAGAQVVSVQKPPVELLVGIWSEEPISDVRAFVDAKQWPSALGRVDGETVKPLTSKRLLSDPRGGYRITVQMAVSGDITSLEEADFVDFVRLAAQSPFQYSPELQESLDRLAIDGSKEQAYLALAESTSLIRMDDFRNDQRFSGYDGSGRAVAVLDTGIDLDHPFFGADTDQDGVADRIVYQYDFADGDGDASDYNGHGTNVTSIMASEDATYTGMAPGADIIALKVFTDGGYGDFGYIENALQWVVDNYDLYNIVSVNMSIGDQGNYQTPQTLYGLDDQMEALVDAGVIVVSASGNEFYTYNSTQGVAYPSADPNSLSIGAVYDANIGYVSYASGAVAYTTAADRIAPFSQRDDELTTVMAPGAAITGAGLGGGTGTYHGTSQAAPHVAGMAAVAQQLAVDELGQLLTQDQFITLLQETGTTVNDGDDEDDNVTNTGLDFPRADMFALGEAIVDLHWKFDANDDPAPGDQADDGTADAFVLTRNGNSIDVTVNGSVVESIALQNVSPPLQDLIRISVDGSTDDDSMRVNSLGTDFLGKVMLMGQNDADDTVYLLDSNQYDEFYSIAKDSNHMLATNVEWLDPETLVIHGYRVDATGFTTIEVESTGGPLDTAYLYDSTGDDHFFADPDKAVLSGPGYTVTATNFPYVHGYAVQGGDDTAEMYDSVGDDSVYAYEDYTKLIGETNFYFRRAKYFEDVTVYGYNGPDPNSQWGDAAYIRDSDADDEFTGYYYNPETQQRDAIMERDVEYTVPGDPETRVVHGTIDRVVDFDYVHGYALYGGVDVAFLYDSPGDDRMKSDMNYVKLWNDTDPAHEFFLRAKYFNYTHAYATSGGFDWAQMRDSNQRDLFAANEQVGLMAFLDYGGGYYRARYFDEVFAVADQGKWDEAIMFDVEGATDHLEAALPEADPNHWGKVYADPLAAVQYMYAVLGFERAESFSSDTEDEAHDTPPEFQQAIDPVTGWLVLDGWL